MTMSKYLNLVKTSKVIGTRLSSFNLYYGIRKPYLNQHFFSSISHKVSINDNLTSNIDAKYDSFDPSTYIKTLESMNHNCAKDSSVDLDLNFSPNIALLTLNNPSSHNSLTSKMVIDLYYHLKTLKKQKDLLGLIITGKGKSFCSGLDFKFVKDELNNSNKGKEFSKFLQYLLNSYNHLDLISISAIEGNALGGGAELTTCTDFRICSINSNVKFVHRFMATVPGFGGSVRVLSILGYQKALYYLGTSSKLPVPNLSESNDFFIKSSSPNKTLEESLKFLNKFIYLNKDKDLVDKNTLKGMKQLMKGLANDKANKQAMKLENELFGYLWAAKANLKAVENALKK